MSDFTQYAVDLERRCGDLEKRIAELEAALRAVVVGYEKEHPARLADFHLPECDCLRCAVDRASVMVGN